MLKKRKASGLRDRTDVRLKVRAFAPREPGHHRAGPAFGGRAFHGERADQGGLGARLINGLRGLLRRVSFR